MLEFIQISHPDIMKDVLKTFSAQKQTWIVSDLKSKQEIQMQAIERDGYFTDDSIMRISDFWRLWIRRLEPTLQVVASDFIKTLVQVFIDQYGEQLALSDSDASTLFKYVQEFAPLIVHPESDQVLREWINAQPSQHKWHEWYLIARTCVRYIIDEKKIIDAKWSASYLQTVDLNLLSWNKELIIDLGTELTSIEMGLFKVLSQKQKVQIFVPHPDWEQKFFYLFKTYRENYGYGSIQSLLSDENSGTFGERKFLKFSTQLAEVKFAVSQVRKWLDQKIAPHHIAIISPDIETYWPALETYLSVEGVPTHKDLVGTLNSFGDIQLFLSYFENLSTDVSWESLEQSLFSHKENPKIRFEKFKSLFFQIFSDNDLKRDEFVQTLFFKKINFTAPVGRQDFLSIIIKYWSLISSEEQTQTLFEVMVKDFLSQSLETSMSFNRWIQFLKVRLSRKEIKIKAGDPEGLQILSLMSAQMSTATHKIYLGLYEEAFAKKRQTLLPIKDIETLKNQFDLALDYPEENYLDFNLRWQSLNRTHEVIYTTPHVGFAAEPLTAALFFLEQAPQAQVVSPGVTRLDEIQRKISHLTKDNLEQKKINTDVDLKNIFLERLNYDLHGQQILLQNNLFQKMTVSEFDQYSKCHFKLLASKGFKLRDLPQASIDLDPRQKGTLAHALFEHLLKDEQVKDKSTEDIELFLDGYRTQFCLYQNEDEFWAVQKSKLVKVAKQFIAFEQNRKVQFRSMPEIPFSIYFNLNTNEFDAVESPDSVTISGRIDRLDYEQSKKYFIIYDYKSSLQQATIFKKWLTEKEFQLLLYQAAIEQDMSFSKIDSSVRKKLNLAKDEQVVVKGALYYLYKNFDVSKGIVEKTAGIEDLDISPRSKSLASEDEIKDLQKKFKEFVAENLQQLKAGDFSARPFQLDICADCDWRKMCRATHLM